jgi:flagellar FliL protein
MTDRAIDDEIDAEEEGTAEAPARKRWSGKRIVLFIVLPLLVTLGGGAGVWFSGLVDFGEAPTEQAAAEGEAPNEAVFLDLPDMLVNLNTSSKRASFLKIKISLEVGSEEDIERLNAVMPRVIDNFHVYLRELRPEDLRGSAGLYRLREELLSRVQTAARPAEVEDVLFKEMLIQ